MRADVPDTPPFRTPDRFRGTVVFAGRRPRRRHVTGAPSREATLAPVTRSPSFQPARPVNDVGVHSEAASRLADTVIVRPACRTSRRRGRTLRPARRVANIAARPYSSPSSESAAARCRRCRCCSALLLLVTFLPLCATSFCHTPFSYSTLDPSFYRTSRPS